MDILSPEGTMDLSDSDSHPQGAGRAGMPPGQATSDDPSCYLAYMLRLWRVETEDGPAWRASVESPHTGETQRFDSLEELYIFLIEKTGRGECGAWPQVEPEPPEEGGGAQDIGGEAKNS
jgi:hypothetical protein